MIKPLRKRHQTMWLLLAFLLPVGFVAAMLVRPEFPVQKLLTTQPALPGGEVIKNARTDHIAASLYQLTDGSYKIVLTLDQPLKSPVTTVYATENTPETLEGSRFLGKVEGKGTYLFPVPSDAFTALLLYDAVHRKIIQTLPF